jgi:hypothetical protein
MTAVFGNTCLVGAAGSLYILLGLLTYMMPDQHESVWTCCILFGDTFLVKLAQHDQHHLCFQLRLERLLVQRVCIINLYNNWVLLPDIPASAVGTVDSTWEG